jgi:hypothetical protein
MDGSLLADRIVGRLLTTMTVTWTVAVLPPQSVTVNETVMIPMHETFKLI